MSKWKGFGKRPLGGHDPTKHKPGSWYEFTEFCDQCKKIVCIRANEWRLPDGWRMVQGKIVCGAHPW